MKEETMKLLRETLDKEKWYELPRYGDKFYTINDEVFIVEYTQIFFDDRIGVLVYDKNGNLRDMFIEGEDEENGNGK